MVRPPFGSHDGSKEVKTESKSRKATPQMCACILRLQSHSHHYCCHGFCISPEISCDSPEKEQTLESCADSNMTLLFSVVWPWTSDTTSLSFTHKAPASLVVVEIKWDGEQDECEFRRYERLELSFLMLYGPSEYIQPYMLEWHFMLVFFPNWKHLEGRTRFRNPL